MTTATGKAVTQHYEDLMSHVQITAIIDNTDGGDIAGRIVREYRDAGDKWHVKPCRLIFIFEDWDGEIAESVEVKDITEYDDAVKELIRRISKPLQDRDIFISVYDNMYPGLQDIELAFENCTRRDYSIMEIVY